MKKDKEPTVKFDFGKDPEPDKCIHCGSPYHTSDECWINDDYCDGGGYYNEEDDK